MALRCAYDQWRCAAWPKPEPQSHCCSSGAIYDEEKENLGVLFCYNIDAFRPPPIRLPSDMRTGCRSPYTFLRVCRMSIQRSHFGWAHASLHRLR